MNNKLRKFMFDWFQRDFRCPFTENCEITVVTRRFCQKCRLDKCFSIGMRKEYIMTEEDKVLKRQKIERNRAKKRPQQEPPKITKLKRENVDVNNFDHETASLQSINSESYIWESDRKYTDLDGNRQQITDSLSPVTTASIPSPSSPLEGANIAGSKTLQMLTAPNCIEKCAENTPRFDQCQVGFDRVLDGGGKYLIHNPSPVQESYEQLSDGVMKVEGSSSTINFDLGISKFANNSEKGSMTSPISSKFEGQSQSTSRERFDLDDPVATSNLVSFINKPTSTSTYPAESSIVSESIPAPSETEIIKDGHSVCHKPKRSCSAKESVSLVSKVMQDPLLITKIFSNPDFTSRIFQDQGFISKIMADTDTVSRLVSDPQISKFLEENDHVSSTDEVSMRPTGSQTLNEFDQTLANNGISDNMIRHMLDAEQKQPIATPILNNLITSKSKTEYLNQNAETSNSTDCVKETEDVTKDVLQEVQRIPIVVNSIESILYEAIKLEFSACSALGGNQNSRELNDAERAKLNELIVANKALLAPLDDDITNLVGEDCRFKANASHSDPALLDVINLTAIAIRRLIKMSKKINAFKNMCQEDQLALLKGGCTEMMILRSALNYDPDKDIWKIPHSQERMSKIRVDVLKEAKGNLYTEHTRFVRNFDPRWRDENIILILSAIALFTPDRPRVIHRDVIKLEQNSYYYLLRRYLESVYPGCEAKSTFLKLIQKISELHRLNDEVVGVYLNVNPSSVEPLLIEIFDLKH
ncbi:uncharacterized protein LOC105688403 isoform X2 [Athalia rosae]|uniref:uncharacterized protein LOC105688403 isoform X2 n=1 Tax=Athalia rosae TaxID=37344 RepID=UPI0020343EE3|nr:uncharacterized protein LOC105688403 isoform X2 [Athalia rosae]